MGLFRKDKINDPYNTMGSATGPVAPAATFKSRDLRPGFKIGNLGTVKSVTKERRKWNGIETEVYTARTEKGEVNLPGDVTMTIHPGGAVTGDLSRHE